MLVCFAYHIHFLLTKALKRTLTPCFNPLTCIVHLQQTYVYIGTVDSQVQNYHRWEMWIFQDCCRMPSPSLSSPSLSLYPCLKYSLRNITTRLTLTRYVTSTESARLRCVNLLMSHGKDCMYCCTNINPSTCTRVFCCSLIKHYLNWQELLAHGISNVFGSFFSCFTSCASLSRSAVQDNQGGKTQIAGLISCSLILVVLVAIGPYFKTLPNVSPLFLLFCASGSNIHA